jgi:PIN domain nuclease of toxin-antitoxin system
VDGRFAVPGRHVIVLDTHVLLWLASDPDRLSADARSAIEGAHERARLRSVDLTRVIW